jgi:ribose-phosphate pyrophosphokinase
VPLNHIDELYKDIIIIDDICDGGATFINIAKEIQKQYELTTPKPKIYLIVTHGIFSKGLEELGEYFESIYCTNSYQDYEPDNDGQDYIYPHLVKQLDVF